MKFFSNRTLTRDLSVGLLAALALAFTVVVGSWYILSIQREYKQLSQKAEELMASSSQVFLTPLWNLDDSEINKIVLAYKEAEILRSLKVWDEHHTLIASYEEPEKPLSFVQEKPLFYQGKHVGVLQFGFTDKFVLEQTQLLFMYAFFMFLAVVVVVFPTVGWLIRSFLHRPLKRIREDLEVIARGGYGHVLSLGTHEDLNALIRSVNNLSLEVRVRTEDIKANYARLQLAKAVQGALLPSDGFQVKVAHVSWDYLPMESVGGDWFHLMESKEALTIVVGDVTGHGLAASLVTMAVAGALHAFEGSDWEPSDLMEKIDRIVLGLSSPSSLRMSCLVARLHRGTKQVSICNAGHPFPWLLQFEQDKSEFSLVSLTKKPNRLLGESTQAHEPFHSWDYPLGVQDRVILYTDGLTQALGQDQQPFYKTLHRRLKKVDTNMDCQSIKEAMLSWYFAHTQGVAADDDVCLVVASLKETT